MKASLGLVVEAAAAMAHLASTIHSSTVSLIWDRQWQGITAATSDGLGNRKSGFGVLEAGRFMGVMERPIC